VVSDGALSAAYAFVVEALTPPQAVVRLIALLNSTWFHPQPLLAAPHLLL
jgi:hypothetical protein